MRLSCKYRARSQYWDGSIISKKLGVTMSVATLELYWDCLGLGLGYIADSVTDFLFGTGLAPDLPAYDTQSSPGHPVPNCPVDGEAARWYNSQATSGWLSCCIPRWVPLSASPGAPGHGWRSVWVLALCPRPTNS